MPVLMFDIVLVFLLLIAFKTAVFLILEGLNLRYLTGMSAAGRALPESVCGIMDDATFARSVDYTRAKSQFSSVSALYDALVLVLILSFGIIPWLYHLLSGILGYGLFGQSAVFILTLCILGLPSLPF